MRARAATEIPCKQMGPAAASHEKRGRRVIIAAVAAALILATTVAPSHRQTGAAAARHHQRPNVVVVLTDDQDSRSLSVMPEVRRRLSNRGRDLREQLRHLLALLPVTHDLAHRAVRPQPPSAGERSAAWGIPGLQAQGPRLPHPARLPAQSRLSHRLRRQIPQLLRRRPPARGAEGLGPVASIEGRQRARHVRVHAELEWPPAYLRITPIRLPDRCPLPPGGPDPAPQRSPPAPVLSRPGPVARHTTSPTACSGRAPTGIRGPRPAT